MLLSEFKDTYATDMGVELKGRNNTYRVYMVAIAGIMSCMESCDSYGRHMDKQESWSKLFDQKRGDYQYTSLVKSIRENGILTPFCITFEGEDEQHIYSFHNGNHRLAAAVELGYTHVPIVFVPVDEGWDKWHVTQLGGMDAPSWAYDEDSRDDQLNNALIAPVMAP